MRTAMPPPVPASFTLQRIAPGAAPPGLLALHQQYLQWVAEGLAPLLQQPVDTVLGGVPAQLAHSTWPTLVQYAPPQGALFALAQAQRWCAMGALRPLPDGSAEVKRLYVHPDFRGRALGGVLLGHLLQQAAQWGYARVRLDTAPFMAAAHRLYRAHGFVPCDPYPGTEVPLHNQARWYFMEARTQPPVHAPSPATPE